MRKKYIMNTKLYHSLLSILLMLVGMGFYECDHVQVWEKDADQMVIAEYISSKPELFSEFNDIINYTGRYIFLYRAI